MAVGLFKLIAAVAAGIGGEVMENLLGKCGCGRGARYTSFKDGKEVGSCNKYQRCPTYDELCATNNDIIKDLFMLFELSDNLRLFKDSSDSYKQAEVSLDKLKLKYGVNNV